VLSGTAYRLRCSECGCLEFVFLVPVDATKAAVEHAATHLAGVTRADAVQPLPGVMAWGGRGRP
jgi:hypothetical protein